MSEYRAILVSREQRDALTAACTQSGPSEYEVQVALAEAFDAAVDEPRILRCKSCGAISDCYETHAQHHDRRSGVPTCYGPFEPGLFVPLPEQP